MRNLYPPKTAKRESLMELRWRHLDHVDSMARGNSSPAELRKTLRKNFEHFFGRLRKRRRDEVPSDELRKDWMVLQIVDLVEERRAELAAEEEAAAYAASK
jgi:hypothetical protein